LKLQKDKPLEILLKTHLFNNLKAILSAEKNGSKLKKSSETTSRFNRNEAIKFRDLTKSANTCKVACVVREGQDSNPGGGAVANW